MVMGLLGIVMAMWRKRREAMVITAFVLTYFILIGKGYTAFARYMVPILPFICLLAALALSEFLQPWLAKRWRAPVARLVLGGLIVLVLVSQAWRGVAFNRLISRVDTRELAVRFAREAFPKGATIGWVGTRQAQRLLIALSALAGLLVFVPFFRPRRANASRSRTRKPWSSPES